MLTLKIFSPCHLKGKVSASRIGGKKNKVGFQTCKPNIAHIVWFRERREERNKGESVEGLRETTFCGGLGEDGHCSTADSTPG